MSSINRSLRRVPRILAERFPTPIALKRPAAMVSDGAGGVVPAVTNPRTGEEINRYLVPDGEPQVISDEEGKINIQRFWLIGEWDDDIRKGDTFAVNGLEHKVIFVDPDHSYQTKALVVRRSG